MSDLISFIVYYPKISVVWILIHFIDKNSRILMIGSSGTGKSNSLLNFIEKSSGEFSQIIICSSSSRNL